MEMSEGKEKKTHPERLAMTAMGLVLAVALVYGSYSFITDYRESRDAEIAKRVAAVERSLDQLEKYQDTVSISSTEPTFPADPEVR